VKYAGIMKEIKNSDLEKMWKDLFHLSFTLGVQVDTMPFRRGFMW
jgi:hypothetical protein